MNGGQKQDEKLQPTSLKAKETPAAILDAEAANSLTSNATQKMRRLERKRDSGVGGQATGRDTLRDTSANAQRQRTVVLRQVRGSG